MVRNRPQTEKKAPLPLSYRASFAAFLLALLPSSVLAAPVGVVLPPVAATRTGQTIVFSDETHDGVSLTGDLVQGSDEVTLSVTEGTLELGGTTTGLTFTSGGASGAHASMTFSADSTSSVNAALSSLTYAPPPGYSGRPTLTMTVSGSQAATLSLRVAVNAILDAQKARDDIGYQVTEVHSGVQPGRLVCYGPEAYDIIEYPGSYATEGPMVGAASWGSGRVVAVPDHQMLNMGSYGDYSGQFYKNAISWLAMKDPTPLDLSVRVVTYDQGTHDWLVGQGYTSVVKTDETGLVSALNNADVFVGGWMGSSEPEGNLEALEDFAAVQGKGLFIADYGAGYSFWWGKEYHNAPGNLLLREPGIGFGSGISWETSVLDASKRGMGQIHAEDVLLMLQDSSGYTADELDRGGYVLDKTFEVLPVVDPLYKRLNDASVSRVDQINPTPNTPVTASFDKALLNWEADILTSTPAAEVTAHRTADAVYGTIPLAPRINDRTVEINTSRTRWHPTGLYAVPGEVVTVTVPSDLVNKGYKVRINSHTDNIKQRSSWERPPYVHRSFTIDSMTLQVANAFGGAIFIDLGGDGFSSPPNVGTAQVTISGAIEHPYFVLGQHTDANWVGPDGLRSKPAPYAVFACDDLVIVQRSSESSTLEKPEELMAWWKQVMVLQDSLAGKLTNRTGAELINVDVQNSAGAAHAGFPIQAYDKHWGNLADLDKLKEEGSWGDFHELGHNQQRGWWTFSGDTEVTVNIFSAYALQNMASNPGTGGWTWSIDPVRTMERAITAVGLNSAYSDKSSLADRLAFWVQLAHWWGWETMTSVFQTYEQDQASNSGALPGSNGEEKDQWLTRFSAKVGHNLVPFMKDKWGLMVSDAAVMEVNGLPSWMPAYGGVRGTHGTSPGTPVTFDLGGSALSLDGTADIVDVTQGAHGTVTDNQDGTYTYIPNLNFVGSDSFSYAVESSTGHKHSTQVHIDVYIGSATLDTWNNIIGTKVGDLTSDTNYINDTPDSTAIVYTLEAPTDRGENFGTRLRCFLVPPATDDYIFWIASDDNGELWLSTDSSNDPANMQMIANVPGWTSPRQWDKFPSDQQSSPVSLVKGQVYYLEALMKEGGGSDNLAVAWQGGGIGQTVITGAHTRPFRATTNQAPVAMDDAVIMDAGSSLSAINVLSNDSDNDGDHLLAMLNEPVSSVGTVTDNGDGTFGYTAAPGFSGTDLFTYSIIDGYGGQDIATVTVTVGAASPTAVPTKAPTLYPTAVPTKAPTLYPTAVLTKAPTLYPTFVPVGEPCSSETECESGICDGKGRNKTCQESNSGCGSKNANCNANNECCSNVCKSNGRCG